MLAIKKPRNARSKRALEKRQPQLNEGVKTALIVNASHSSALVSTALHQLSSLKKPHTIPFTKKKSNDVNPFVDSSSIEFLSTKNDAPLLLVGDSRKKRKDNLTWIRLFDGKVMDMLEMGIDAMKGVEEFKVSVCLCVLQQSPFSRLLCLFGADMVRALCNHQPPSHPDVGSRPLFHFSGPQFAADAASTYPAHAHLKSLFLDFYRGEEVLDNGIPVGGKVALQGGLQFVISITAGGIDESQSKPQEPGTTNLADMYASGAASSSNGLGSSAGPSASVDTSATGCKVFFRVYSLTIPPKTPARAVPSQFKLDECGPAFDFTVRRRLPSDPTLLSHALKRGKTQAEKNRQGKSDTYKKNIETDEMGDMVGRVHVGKQDLSKLQTRKMKGLKAGKDDAEDGQDSDDGDDDDDDDELLEGDSDDEFMALGDGLDNDEDEDGDEDGDEEDMERLAAARGDLDGEESGAEEVEASGPATARKRGRRN